VHRSENDLVAHARNVDIPYSAVGLELFMAKKRSKHVTRKPIITISQDRPRNFGEIVGEIPLEYRSPHPVDTHRRFTRSTGDRMVANSTPDSSKMFWAVLLHSASGSEAAKDAAEKHGLTA
jgi:hypothetical protein